MAAVGGPAAGTPWFDRLLPWLLGLASIAAVLAEDKGGAPTLSNSLSPLEGWPAAPNPVTPSWLSGSWGPWSPWSACSRSCGTGVAVQTRECRRRVRSANKKKDKKKHRKRSERSKHELEARRRKSRVLSTQCVGQYKRVHVCNEQECPRGTPDFRALQCEAHNKHDYSGHFYQWEPYLAAPDPCQLNCRAKGFRFYATLNQSVVDGTACLPSVAEPVPLLAARRSRWLCVSGICQRVGCDGVVGSSARLDGCGVCGGDNSTCRTVSGIFTRPQLPQGFNVIAVLPQGACNVTIAQLKPTINLLSVRRQGGSPVLHGGGRPSWPGVYEAAGTRFTYTQADPVRGVAETLSAPGPLSKPMELLLMYQQPNPGIKYEYSVPLARRELGASGAAPTALLTTTPALAAPSTPLLTTTPAPAERNDGDNEVADGFPFGQGFGQDVLAMDAAADATPKAGKGRRFMWKVTGYSECSKTCGGGVQEAQVHCVRHNSLLPVSPYRCAGQEKPYEFLVPKTCSTRPCPAQWVTGDWSGCSVTCGSGTQTREQSCRQEISTSLAVRVADGACLGARPEVTLVRACVQPPCHHHHHHHHGHHHVAHPRPPPPPQRDLQAAATPAPAASWSAGPWGQCSVECGRGVRSRTVSCPDGATCAPGDQPPAQEACDAGPCSSTAAGALAWLASEWSSHCSAECGTGVQSRSVVCSAAASKCDPRHRPPHTRACSSEGASCRGQWFASPWGPCSATCGQGAQTRGVACLQWQRGQARLEVRDDDFCDPRQKPEPQQPCAERACPPHWYAGEWSECSQSCGTGAQKREVRCIGPGGPSSACSKAAKLPSRKACHLQACSSAQSPPETQDDPADSGVPCEDRLRNCHLVVQARLCKYSYYGSSCCSSCRRKGD